MQRRIVLLLQTCCTPSRILDKIGSWSSWPSVPASTLPRTKDQDPSWTLPSTKDQDPSWTNQSHSKFSSGKVLLAGSTSLFKMVEERWAVWLLPLWYVQCTSHTHRKRKHSNKNRLILSFKGFRARTVWVEKLWDQLGQNRIGHRRPGLIQDTHFQGADPEKTQRTGLNPNFSFTCRFVKSSNVQTNKQFLE